MPWIRKLRRVGGYDKSSTKQNRDDKDREDGVSQDQETQEWMGPTTSRASSRTETTRIGRRGFPGSGNTGGEGPTTSRARSRTETTRIGRMGFPRIRKHRRGGADYKSCIKQNRDDKDREDGVSQDQETQEGRGRRQVVHQAEQRRQG